MANFVRSDEVARIKNRIDHPIIDSDGHVVGASKVARDITARRRAQAQQALLLNEMKHRVKNTLATAQAIATQTLSSVSKEERAALSTMLAGYLFDHFGREATFLTLAGIAAIGATLVFLLLRETRPNSAQFRAQPRSA